MIKLNEQLYSVPRIEVFLSYDYPNFINTYVSVRWKFIYGNHIIEDNKTSAYIKRVETINDHFLWVKKDNTQASKLESFLLESWHQEETERNLEDFRQRVVERNGDTRLAFPING